MSLIPSLIIIAYSVLFYLVGVLLLAPPEIVLNVILFNVFLVMAFLVKVSYLNKRLIKVSGDSYSYGDFKIGLWVFLAVTFSPFLLMYLMSGVPVLGSDVEVDRMVLVNKYGVVYRIAVQAIFFIPPILILGYAKGKVSKITLASISLATLVLLVSTGFRSRLVDFIFIYIISILAIHHNAILFLVRNMWKVLPTSLVFFIGAFVLIVYLTSLREGVELQDALLSVIHRVFILNYEVNFDRIFSYVEVNGFKNGATFLTDFLSIISSQYRSMQVEITQYFNKVNSDLFIMTPTVYGEFYLNFGMLSCVFVFPVVVIYRALFENFFALFSRLKYSNLVFFSGAINLIYYVPRQIVTGGVSNAYLIRGMSLIIVSAMLFSVFYFVKSLGRVR